MSVLRFLPGPATGARRNLQQRRSHAGAPRVCSCRGQRHETGRPWQYHGTQGASQSRLPDILTTAAVPGRSAALDVCLASSIAAAARGDDAQAALDRKLLHYRNELEELRQQGIHYRPLVWTADGVCSRHRIQPEWAADVGEITPSQVKHEIQIALLRRRAAMAGAVLPNPSARAEWPLVGILDRALHHWGHVPALDGVTTTSLTPRLTQQYQTTTTLSPWRATRMSVCSHQVSDCPVCSSGEEVVFVRRWLSHAVSRTHSVAVQCPPPTISATRTASRTTGSQGNLCLTC